MRDIAERRYEQTWPIYYELGWSGQYIQHMLYKCSVNLYVTVTSCFMSATYVWHRVAGCHGYHFITNSHKTFTLSWCYLLKVKHARQNVMPWGDNTTLEVGKIFLKGE